MSDPLDHLPLTAANLVDRACLRFEADWKNGRDPRIEDVLAVSAAEEPVRSSLFQSLLLLELELRQSAGQSPAPKPYQKRFPEYAKLVAEIFRGASRRSTQLSRDTSRAPRSEPGGRPSSHPTGGKSVKVFSGQFGRYRIVKPLGHGGMGSVYLAHDTELDRQVALKIPFFDQHDGPDVLERFQREAKAAAAFEHPHICPIYDVGEQDGTIYLTMPYIAGKSLSQFVASGKSVPQRQAAKLVVKLARALQEAHNADIVHRDLKPSNVMINQRKQPVIMDFGLARRMDQQESRITKSGTVVGTPTYMPPEQVRGELDAVGPQSDIYSLGAILYELLSGHPPFEGPLMSVLGRILTEEPAPPSAYREDVRPRLESICRKAMAKQLNDRYASMDELVQELTQFLQEESGTKSGQDFRLSGAGESNTLSGSTTIFRAIETFAKSVRSLPRPDANRNSATIWNGLLQRPKMALGAFATVAMIVVALAIQHIANDVVTVSEVQERAGRHPGNSHHGTVRIQIDVPDAVVSVDGNRITLDGFDNHVQLETGRHKLVVERNGAVVLEQQFTLTEQEEKLIPLSLLRNEDAERMENSIVIQATGQKDYTGRNGDNQFFVDFSRDDKRLRLERVFVTVLREGNETKISGRFAVTHMLGALRNRLFYVSFAVRNGAGRLRVTNDKVESRPLNLLLDHTAIDTGSESSVNSTGFTAKVQDYLADFDAGPSVASFVEDVIEEAISWSMKYVSVIKTYTKGEHNSRTHDSIWITLNGTDNVITKQLLDNPLKNDFERSQTDRFFLFTSQTIGELRSIVIEKGGDDGWYLGWLEVDIPNGKTRIAINKWLDNERGTTPRVSIDVLQ